MNSNTYAQAGSPALADVLRRYYAQNGQAAGGLGADDGIPLPGLLSPSVELAQLRASSLAPRMGGSCTSCHAGSRPRYLRLPRSGHCPACANFGRTCCLSRFHKSSRAFATARNGLRQRNFLRRADPRRHVRAVVRTSGVMIQSATGNSPRTMQSARRCLARASPYAGRRPWRGSRTAIRGGPIFHPC